MKLYVAAFPNLGFKDQWIHEKRSKYDPVAKFIPPHLTLVFPSTAFNIDELRQETSKLVRGFEPFRVVLRSAIVMPEVGNSRSHAHVFLVPDEGFSQIVRLHDRLYSGILANELRLDIPYIPHLTVAAGLHLTHAKSVADDLNGMKFQITIEISGVNIIEIREQESDRFIDHPIPLG